VRDLSRRQQRQAGGGIALAVATFVVWVCGRMGIVLTAEMGTLVGGLFVAGAAAIWAEGLKNVFVHIWTGDDGHHHKVTVETKDDATVTVEDMENKPDT
jgi:hypothetical protein